jgi:endoglycosylceramidase
VARARTRVVLAVTALALAALVPAPASLAAPSEPLGHAGRWITDADGRVVIVHGANVVPSGFEAPPERPAEAGFTRADAEFLAAHGFNAVRLGWFHAGLEPQPDSYDDSYLEHYERIHGLLAGEGIFTLLGMHQDQYAVKYKGRGLPQWAALDNGLPNTEQGFPGGYFTNPALLRAYDNFWANAAGPGGVGIQDRFAAAWRRVAARFAGKPRVLGYDIFNEPWPGSPWPTCANTEGCPPGGFDQTQLTAFSNRVIAAIRQGDARRLAFYEPNLQFDVGAKTRHGKVGDPNAGFSFHNYCLGAAPGLPHAPDPANLCRDVGERMVFQNAESHSAETGAALLMTEFGDVVNPAIHERIVDLADEFMVGWTVWSWFRAAGQIKKDPRKPPTPDNVHQDLLAANVRPFPRLIAGTPTRYGFDRRTKRFEARFATRLPNGRPAGRLESEVYVPRLHYGGAYRVAVRGAQITGGLGTQLLRLRNCPGADSVSVTVSDRSPGETLTCAEQAAGRLPCVPRRLRVSHRRIGSARLGARLSSLRRRYRTVRRGRRAWRFCVRGGGRFLVGSKRGRIDLVASTARGHRTRRVGPGSRLRRGRLRGGRRIARGLLVGHRAGSGRVVYAVRRGRVRFVAVVRRRAASKPRSLARRLRRAGLDARRS